MVDAAHGNDWYRSWGKRAGDVLGAALLTIGLSPVMLLTAVGVRLALGSPVLFRQERAGHEGRTFTLVKFRSMLDERDTGGKPLSDEERLRPFGRILRRTSLDELPELFNVLQGSMSLVGPRPLLTRYNDRYSTEQARRLTVKPGLTGWAQVNGRNATTWADRLALDVWYVDHVSPKLDLKILLRTIPVVLRGDGITPDGEPFMPEFIGDAGDNSTTDRQES